MKLYEAGVVATEWAHYIPHCCVCVVPPNGPRSLLWRPQPLPACLLPLLTRIKLLSSGSSQADQIISTASILAGSETISHPKHRKVSPKGIHTEPFELPIRHARACAYNVRIQWKDEQRQTTFQLLVTVAREVPEADDRIRPQNDSRDA